MALKWPQWRLTQQRGENSLFSGIGATELCQSPLPFLVHACNKGPWMVFLGRYLSNWENISINTIKPDWRAKNFCANFRLSHFSPVVLGKFVNLILSEIGKDSDAGRDWGQEEKGTTEDEMARWHHWLDGCESEWTPGVGDRQGGLACCDSWGRKESDTTERLNWTELMVIYLGTLR